MLMERDQMVLLSEDKLNGSTPCNGSGFQTVVNNLENIPCNGHELGAEVNGVEKKTNDLIEDFDLYLEDISDRLMILRMVNDSVTKGMVNAVEQEAAERIAAKELEVASLKRFRELELDKIKCLELSVKNNELTSKSCGRQLRHSDISVDHDEVSKSLRSLKITANEHFQKLKKEIDDARGCTSIRRIGSASELLGLGGSLQEKECESWVRVDKMLSALKTTVDTMWGRVDDVIQLSRNSLYGLEQEQEFQGEVEAMVIQRAIRSLQEEFEEKLWDQNARLGGILSVNWPQKFNEISSLRTELDAIWKLLSPPETVQLNSQGSDDMSHNSHLKAVGNHVVSSPSLWLGNGKLEDSKIDVPENFDAAQLTHMTKPELVNYFNTIITNMRRDHESIVQKRTEEHFSLKREYLNLKERGASLPHRKDIKEFEMVRKKIPDVVMTLERILTENSPASTYCAVGVGNLKDRLAGLLSENSQLKDLLSDKETELKHLSLQVSQAEEKISQHSLAEEDMLNLIANLNSTIEDERIEASINGLIYKCFLMELSGQVWFDSEESDMEILITRDIYESISGEAAASAESIKKCSLEDSDIEAFLMHDFCGLIFREIAKDAEENFTNLHSRYWAASERNKLLEKKAFDKESRLWEIIAEKEKLWQEVLALKELLQEKEKLAGDLSMSLTKEKEQFELLSKELENVRAQVIQQQTQASERSKECELVRGQLVDALKTMEEDKVKIWKLHEMLDSKTEDLKNANQQREIIEALSEDRHRNLLLAEAKEKGLKKQMETVVLNIHGMSQLFSDFESEATRSIEANALRLKDLGSHAKSLVSKANSIRRTSLVYRQKLERRCTDLRMAEAEVDLLGDEVDALSGLLEKMYIALDHYSPVLKHYPGVMEILQLIRRELLGEFTKSG